MFHLFRTAALRRQLLISLLLGYATLGRAEQGLTFDQALQAALQDSAEIRAMSSRVESAREGQIPAAALPDPTLVLGLDNVPIEGDDRYSLSSERMTMQRIGLTQRFPNQGKRQARAEAAEHQVELAQAQAESTRLYVQRQTAIAWIKRHTLAKQLSLLDERLKENRLFDQAVQAGLSSGQGKAMDSIAPRREAAELLERQDALLAQQQQAQAQLVRWLGEPGRQPLAGDAPDFSIDGDQLLHSLHQHPELAVIEREAAVAGAAAQEARAAKKPDWSLTLAYLNREDFSDMATLQVNMDLPLFGKSRQGPRIAAAEAEQMALEAQADAVRREHKAMLESELADYQRLSSTLKRQRTVLVPLAEEKIALATAAWRGGDSSLADLVQARAEWLEARLTEISLAGQRYEKAAALHFTYEHHDPVGEDNDYEH